MRTENDLNIKTNSLSDFIVLIRGANERTEELCKKLIVDQGVNEDNVRLIRESPFSKALLKTFEIGIEKDKKWTFCVDADVLLRPGSIHEMVRLADSQHEKVCQVQGYMMDKFFGGVRKGGVHLYRTSLLDKVIKHVPVEGTAIRPESYALQKMSDNGYPTSVVPYVVGLHDFEQYNFDIYRKAFVQAEKHQSRAELFIKLWKKRADSDFDYKVALRGFSDSVYNTQQIFIDNKQPLYLEKFNAAGIKEKQVLVTSNFTLGKIESIISYWIYPEIYQVYFPYRDGLDLEMKGNWKKVKRNIKEKGYYKTGILVVSEILMKMGKKLRKHM